MRHSKIAAHRPLSAFSSCCRHEAALALRRYVPIADISSAANCTLLDHLVGAGKKRWRHREAERLAVVRSMTRSNFVEARRMRVCYPSRPSALRRVDHDPVMTTRRATLIASAPYPIFLGFALHRRAVTAVLPVVRRMVIPVSRGVVTPVVGVDVGIAE